MEFKRSAEVVEPTPTSSNPAGPISFAAVAAAAAARKQQKQPSPESTAPTPAAEVFHEPESRLAAPEPVEETPYDM